MAIVAARTNAAPQYTNNSLKYYYSFVQPPAAWSAQSPGGIICDDKIMPNRDIDDAANGTDTWKVLRGVDLYFAAEGALERYYAGNQFQLPYSWPRSTYTVTRSKGVIESNLWQWTQGDDPQTTIKNGLAGCYDNLWLKGLSSSSDLQATYSTWADGTPIDGNDPPGYFFTGRTGWQYFLDFAIGKWALSDMVSRYSDFEPGDPLVADNVRRVYYDLQRLQWYITETGTGESWKVAKASTTAWTRTSWTRLQDYTPLEPLTGTSEVWHEERRYWDVGEPEQRGGYWGFYTNAGVYRTPRTGLLNDSGQNNTTTYFGSEQACYLALHLTWGGDDVDQQDRYEYWKVPYSISQLGQVEVTAARVAEAAGRMVSKYNAGVPQSVGAADRFCMVYVDHVDIVCKIGDRTDVSQLGWTWAPA